MYWAKKNPPRVGDFVYFWEGTEAGFSVAPFVVLDVEKCEEEDEEYPSGYMIVAMCLHDYELYRYDSHHFNTVH